MSITFNHLFQMARNGMLSRLDELDNVSQNVANANTQGYKRTRMNFQEVLNEQNELSGTKISSTQMNMEQGAMRQSDSPLHMAIGGDGFFAVKTPDGQIGYTRSGSFQLDADGQIVSDEGFPLVWDGEIPADTTKIDVKVDGSVFVEVEDGNSIEVGRISLYRFVNPSGLTPSGKSVYLATDVSGAAQQGEAGGFGFGTIAGYNLEQSNVSMSESMTQIVILQHAYSITAKALSQTDNMIAQAIRMRTS